LIDPLADAGSGGTVRPLRWTVNGDPAAGGARPRLDRWLTQNLPDRTRSQIQNDIAAGRVRVNGAVQPARYSVAAGDRIDYDVPQAEPRRLQPEAIPLNIVFEDEHLAVIDKPAGLVVHPAPGHSGGTLANALLAHCGPSLEGVGGEGRWGIVHRLDAGTSGLLITAKTTAAHEALTAALADRRIHRQYLGLSIGQMREAVGTIDRPIGRRSSDRKKMGVIRDGRPARTDWRVLLESDGLGLLALTLHTGRTHQIRVHLQAIGHPILGDGDYGWTRPRTLQSVAGERRRQLIGLWPKRPMLHAARLVFQHPMDAERTLTFESPPPKDFAAIAEAWWGEKWEQAIRFEDPST
jgi:23S rRNA pseudouridine1911/1915/1917 synthase